MFCTVLGSRTGMKGVHWVLGRGKLLVTLLSQSRWALLSANSLLACNLYPTFPTRELQEKYPSGFNSSASLSQAVNETGFEKSNRYLKLLFLFIVLIFLPLVSMPGLQIIFPQYLQEKFVQSALSYIMCNGEGEYICRNSQCGCQCAEEFPQCNCPITDIQIMEYTLANMAKTWTEAYKDLENSGNRAKHIF